MLWLWVSTVAVLPLLVPSIRNWLVNAFLRRLAVEARSYWRDASIVILAVRGRSLRELVEYRARTNGIRLPTSTAPSDAPSVDAICRFLDSPDATPLPILLIGLGDGSRQALAEVQRHRGDDVFTLPDVQEVMGLESSQPRTDTDAALKTLHHVRNQVAAGGARSVLILISPPVTPPSERSRLGELIDEIASLACEYSLFVENAGDPSKWPPQVAVDVNLPVPAVRLGVRGQDIAANSSTGRTVVLGRLDAANLLRSIATGTSATDWPTRQADSEAAEEVQLWRAHAQLCRGLDLLTNDTLFRTGWQDCFTTLGMTVTGYANSEPGRQLAHHELSTFHVYRSFPGQPPIVNGESRDVSEDIQVHLATLRESLERSDDSQLVQVLSEEGRSWVETGQPVAIEALREVEAHTAASIRARLWARFLLALDDALHLDRPSAYWFDGASYEMAQSLESDGLGLLYAAERAEFARLRNELESSTSMLNELLARMPGEPQDDPASAYCWATTQFVIANMLRRGGQYALAREHVAKAESALDPAINAHRVELIHCLYAKSVCDALLGNAIHRELSDGGSPSATFAESLVTLSNSHAAWAIRDYERAIGFATDASSELFSIGFERYAKRAEQLSLLLQDWRDLEVNRSIEPRSPEVAALLSAPVGADIRLLESVRPSRALSLLQFCSAFGSDPDAVREVRLPRLIEVSHDGSLQYVNVSVATSFTEAELALRSLLGVGEATAIPLAAD